jgi:two-component system response regulator DesR
LLQAVRMFEATNRDTSPLRVVVADDDEMIRGLMRHLFALVPDVEIVGEAADGSEAVELVQAVEAEVVLLDVDMPGLDGIAAAEVIRSFRPDTRIVLHTGRASGERRRQAAALDVPLLEKGRMRETIEEIGRGEHRVPPEIARFVEPIVLLALAGHGHEAVLIVARDGSIPFYNRLAASLLRLPWPSEVGSLSALRARLEIVDEEGLPREIGELPLERALAERVAAIADVTCRFVEDGTVARLTMASLPFFSPTGDFTGVGNYLVPRTGP